MRVTKENDEMQTAGPFEWNMNKKDNPFLLNGAQQPHWVCMWKEKQIESLYMVLRAIR